MKRTKIISSILFISAMVAVAGCEHETPTAYVNDPAVYFKGVTLGKTTYQDSVSFSFLDVEGDEHQLELEVIIQGMLSDKDRVFGIKQVDHPLSEQAIFVAAPGTDYVPFDDPAVSSVLVIKAGENRALVPLIFKDTEKLIRGRAELVLELIPSDDFRLGIPARQQYKVSFTSRPEKPKEWNDWKDYFGTSWGPVKHTFIIENCGAIDFAISPMAYSYMSVVASFYRDRCRLRLNEYNDAHPNDHLKEADGVEVTFLD